MEQLKLSNFRKIHSEVLSLPMGPTLSLKDAQFIVDVCNGFKLS
jgi:dTDP-4-amino-4,6-dideoxygalactose transaminase